jgi:hypothetical protein
MNELLYGINSAVIAAVLLLTMMLATEVGYRVGLRRKDRVGDAAREHVNGVQGAILGILALLLGFTFSLSLQRFDSRSEAVVDEANAIGTAVLRIDLLPAPMRDDMRRLLGEYVDLRVQSARLTTVDRGAYRALLARTTALQNTLWERTRAAVALDPGAYPPTMFVEAVNQMFDSFGKRNAVLDRHVPELVLLLLYVTFVMAGGIVGFACGVAGHRPSLASHLLVALMVVLVFIVLDLDRPQRGLIRVSDQSLVDLQASMRR